MSADPQPIDPLQWIGAERAVLTQFASEQASAAADLQTTIAEFQDTISCAATAEAQFTDELVSIAASLNPAALNKTESDLSGAEAAIDASFGILQAQIMQNNQSAQTVAATMSASKDTQAIAQTRTGIASKISSYSRILGTFRSYKAATDAPPPPPAPSPSPAPSVAAPAPSPSPDPDPSHAHAPAPDPLMSFPIDSVPE